MTTAAKPICDAATLPDPTGDYLTMVFPHSVGGGKNQPGWMEWQAYYVNLQITLSGTNCQIVCGQSSTTVPYTQNGNDPNSGNLQFSFSVNSNNCSYNIDVYQPSGRGLVLQGTVTIALSGGPKTLEARMLKLPVSLPSGTYDVTSVTNSALTGRLILGVSSTFQQTGENAQPITPAWNGTGAPNRSMLAFSADIVVNGVTEPTDFNALYAPKWSGSAFSQKFHGTASQGPTADDSDWSAQDSSPEP